MRKKRKAIRVISESAEKASRCLWTKRLEPWSTIDELVWRYLIVNRKG